MNGTFWDNTNLLNETVEAIADAGRSVDEVHWVGDVKHGWRWTWGQFADVAKDYVYDSGFGGAELNENLLVVAEDWWLERHEYDGSEWWEYKTHPAMPASEVPVETRLLANE